MEKVNDEKEGKQWKNLKTQGNNQQCIKHSTKEKDLKVKVKHKGSVKPEAGAVNFKKNKIGAKLSLKFKENQSLH